MAMWWIKSCSFILFLLGIFFTFVQWNHFGASSKQALGILETGYIIMIHDGGFMHAGRVLKQRR